VKFDTGVALDLTKAGALPVDKNAVPQFGEVGQLIGQYRELMTQLEFYEKYASASARSGRLHGAVKSHGTITGRGSGGKEGASASKDKLNVQQLPKVQGILETFTSGRGLFFQMDIAALEPQIQAQFSRDATLREVYMSGQVHDKYLYFAQFIHPDAEFREELRANYQTGTENIARIKRKYKPQRSFVKPFDLAMSYGGSGKTLHKQAQAKGMLDVTRQQCDQIHQNYWQMLAGLKQFGYNLRAEVEDRGGYLLNGFGRPMCVPDDKLKDVLNRFVQSTGHDFLLTWLYHLDIMRHKRGWTDIIPVVHDYHDETVWHGPPGSEDRGRSLLEDSFQAANDQVCKTTGYTPFKGEVMICKTFADFKLD
jgi:hypothetical protein